MERDDLRLPPGLQPRQSNRRYAGVWVGVTTVAVAAATLFCEARLTAAPIDQTVMTAAIMILSCFIMYTSLFDTGHQKAEQNEMYRKIEEAYRVARDAAQPHLARLEEFCSQYVKEELDIARRQILERAGLGVEALAAWRCDKMDPSVYRNMSRAKRRALKRAARLKPIRLRAAMLLSGDRRAHRAPALSSASARVRRTVTALLPTIVGSLITVAVTLEGVALTPAAVISGILRIFTIVWCGVRGYTAGVCAVKEDDGAVLSCKIAYLTAFQSYMKSQNKES